MAMLIVEEAFYLKSQMRVSISFLGLPWHIITTMWLTTLEKCSLTVLEPGLLHQGVNPTMLPGKPGRVLPGFFLVSGGFQQSLVFLDLYRYTLLSKSSLYERSILVPVFTNWKKSEEEFCFYEKSWKAKIAFRICFAVSLSEAAGTPRHPEWHHQPLPREFQHLQHLS